MSFTKFSLNCVGPEACLLLFKASSMVDVDVDEQLIAGSEV